MSVITVGRANGNNIVLSDKSISNYHSKFVIENDGTLWIHDLNSTNGTFVNGNKIAGKKQLTPQDSVKLGLFPFNWQEQILVSASEGKQIEDTISEDSEEMNPEEESFEPVAASNTAGKDSTKMISVALTVLLLGFAFLSYVNGWIDTDMFNSEISDNDEYNDYDNDEYEEDDEDEESEGGEKKKRKKKKRNKGRTYSVECLDDGDGFTDIIDIGNEIKKETTKMMDVKVSVKEEEKVGREVKNQVDRDYTYNHESRYNDEIEKIFNKLKKALGKTKYNYKWYIINSDQINAFTAGGYIFITTAIIDFAERDDELACIIGHEIYHNELGHIRDKVRDQKIAREMFGDELGELAAVASAVLSTPFNQENEAYCDLYGLDLAFDAGYDGCAASQLWDRMSEKESEGDELDKFFRSHPYSSQRSTCVHNHVETNHKGRKCKH